MLFDNNKFLLIAGTCSLETRDITLRTAEKIAETQDKYKDTLISVFKGSFDKANRTSKNSQRGAGIVKGLAWLAEVKNNFSLPVITDIHNAEQANLASSVCDVLQIPAFLCRQTDILLACAKTDKVINIKKGQILAPSDMQHAVNKVLSEKKVETWITERGTTFGYGNLVVDMRSIPIMKKTGCPVIIDASHGIQLPSANGEQSSGQIEFLPIIAKSAISAGADGLFLETHPNPQKAISDKDSQLPLKNFSSLIEECIRLWLFTKGRLVLQPMAD